MTTYGTRYGADGPDDRMLVEAMRRGDPAGLEGVYRRYADRLYTYARAVLREPEAAADAVHDAFLTAGQRIDQLRDPDRLRPWLYAIVRNECLRRIRERSRSLPLEEAGEPPADLPDHGAQVGTAQVRELVHAAVAALNPGDREVVDLALRHDLSSAEIRAALGVPANHAHARLSRARAQLERALGALLVARTGARDCPALAGLLTDWRGRLSPTLRKRVARHIEDCAVCMVHRREQLNPAALLSAYTAPPFLVVADSVWPRVAEASARPSPATSTGESAATASGSAAELPSSTGSATEPPSTADSAAQGTARARTGSAGAGPSPTRPVTPSAVRGPHRARRRATMAGLTLLALLLLGTGVALDTGPDVPPTGILADPLAASRSAARSASAPALAADAARPTGARSAAAGSPTGAGPMVADASPVVGTGPLGRPPAPASDGGPATRPATPSPDGPAAKPGPAVSTIAPTRRPPMRPSAQVAAMFTISASAQARCGRGSYSLVITAEGSAELAGARLRWGVPGATSGTQTMAVEGRTARVTLGDRREPTLTWSVHGTATDGRTAGSPTYTVTDRCPAPVE